MDLGEGGLSAVAIRFSLEGWDYAEPPVLVPVPHAIVFPESTMSRPDAVLRFQVAGIGSTVQVVESPAAVRRVFIHAGLTQALTTLIDTVAHPSIHTRLSGETPVDSLALITSQ